MSEERLENCVVFCDGSTWVACTIQVDHVAQGKSPMDAVKRLQWHITATEVLRERLEHTDGGMTPAPSEFQAMFQEAMETVPRNEGNVSRVYRSTVRYGLTEDRRRRALALEDV